MARVVTVSDVAAESVTLTWTDAVNTAATYTVTYGETSISVQSTTAVIDNLTPETNYTFTVTANCSADDAANGVSVAATTLPSCAPATN